MNPRRSIQVLIRSLCTSFAPGAGSVPSAVTLPVADGSMTCARGRVVPLEISSPVEIECTAGAVWLTSADTPEDLILTAGQRYAVTGANRLLAQSLTGCGGLRLHPIESHWEAPHDPASNPFLARVQAESWRIACRG